MKPAYVRDLEPNQLITSVFLVHSKDIRQKKTGEPYLALSLGDRTGDVDAKMWDNVAEVMDTFDRSDFVRVKGLLQVYQNRPQLTIHKMIKIDDREVDFKDYFPASERDSEEMFAELQALIAGLSNPHLKALLEAVFADADIARRVKVAPAAKLIHHAFLGGLLEHILSVCALCRKVGPHYRDIDIDLLLAGAVLHDLGKIYELSYDRGFGYTSDGQLLGHIVITLRVLTEKLAGLPGFPARLRTLLEHMILSHHGELEFGSPKVPLFAEALLLHHLDNLDSKMECVRASVQNDRQVEGCWTGYCSALDRALLKKGRYLQEQEAATSPPAPSPPAAAPQAPRRNDPLARPGSLFAGKLQDALRRDS